MRIRLRWPVALTEREQLDKKSIVAEPVLGDRISAFYSKRAHMEQSSYDGIRKELDTAKRQISAAWHGGPAAIVITSKEQRKKICQLILLHPWNSDVGMYGTRDAREARENIIRTTQTFQDEGVSVKWFNGPFSLITVIDDGNRDWARVRVEAWLIHVESEDWQNYVIYQKDNQDAYATIKAMFDTMWGKAIVAPMGDELEKFKNEKPQS